MRATIAGSAWIGQFFQSRICRTHVKAVKTMKAVETVQAVEAVQAMKTVKTETRRSRGFCSSEGGSCVMRQSQGWARRRTGSWIGRRSSAAMRARFLARSPEPIPSSHRISASVGAGVVVVVGAGRFHGSAGVVLVVVGAGVVVVVAARQA
jgi:hypothetical protein